MLEEEICGPCDWSISGLRSLFCLLAMWGPATFLPRITGSSQCFLIAPTLHHLEMFPLSRVKSKANYCIKADVSLGAHVQRLQSWASFTYCPKGPARCFLSSQLAFREDHLHLLLRKDPLENVCVSGGRASVFNLGESQNWSKTAWEMRIELLSHHTALQPLSRGLWPQPGSRTAASITPVLPITGDPVLWGC